MKLLVILFFAFVTCASTKYDHYLLSCGAPSGVVKNSSWDGRTWYSDDNSTFSDDFSSTASARTSNAPNPFSRARIFISNFTYNFPISPGPKFIRLFFNPSPSPYVSPFIKSFSAADAYITVLVNSGELLLRNFSADPHSENNYVQKELYVHITGSVLQLTFFPTPPSSYAFINGIEIVSIPDNLYVGSFPPENVANPRIEFHLDSSTTLETAYRLNVGGLEINSSEDTGSPMYRRWVNDDTYLIGNITGSTDFSATSPIKYTPRTPTYSAPEDVYRSYRTMGILDNELRLRVNLTWGFEVDLGFYYLVRLHWCEIVPDMKAVNYRVFDVYIAEQMADQAIDVFGMVGGGYTPVFKDYVVYMEAGDGGTSRGLLKLAMHPNPKSRPVYYDVLLNGLEIFKLNNLNYAQAAHQVQPNGSHKKATNFHVSLVAENPSKRLKLMIVGAIGGTVVLSSLVVCLRRMSATNDTKGSTVPTDDVCHRFSLAQIKLATNDFIKNSSLDMEDLETCIGQC